MSDIKESKTDNAMEVESEDKPVVDEHARDPLLDIAEWRFVLEQPDDVFSLDDKKAAKDSLMTAVKEKSMTLYYQDTCAALGWDVDQKLVASLKEANDKELVELEAAIEEAKKNAGDTEVREASLKKADFFARIGDKDRALTEYNDTLEKTVGQGLKIDIELTLIRFGLFINDMDVVKTHIEKTRHMVETGGDWERRNLLKVYEGVYSIIIRDFERAASLLLDSVSTFTCYKLTTYNQFIFYAVVCSVISLDRVTLKKKVVSQPEILSCYHEIDNIESFVESLYRCRYKDFFQALVDMTPQFKRDRFFSAHYGYFMREVRVVVYKQYLQAYKSVKLQSMADAFGVSAAFLDKELSRFIASGRLNCKIDKVNLVIETNRPDAKNAQYNSTIKQGDLLLNRIQKLAKIVSF